MGAPQPTAEQEKVTAQPGTVEPVVGQPTVEGDATGERPDTEDEGQFLLDAGDWELTTEAN